MMTESKIGHRKPKDTEHNKTDVISSVMEFKIVTFQFLIYLSSS